jgi:hypothetical protein
MSRPRPFLPQLLLAWREEIRQLSDHLQEVGARLGTPAEQLTDFETARHSRQRLTTLQLACVGIDALIPRRRRRSRSSATGKSPACPDVELFERHIA